MPGHHQFAVPQVKDNDAANVNEAASHITTLQPMNNNAMAADSISPQSSSLQKKNYLVGVIARPGQADSTPTHKRNHTHMSDDSDLEEVWQRPVDEVTSPVHHDTSRVVLPTMPPAVEQQLKSGQSHQVWPEVSAYIITPSQAYMQTGFF